MLIAASIIALMFILAPVRFWLIFHRSKSISSGPIPQVLAIAFRGFSWAGLIGPVVILLLVGRQLGACTLAVAGSTRLPMVAGWDNLLPQWFRNYIPNIRRP